MNGLYRQGSGNDAEMPFQKGMKNNPVRDVISWGGREYDIEEFRSLLMRKPEDTLGEYHDGT